MFLPLLTRTSGTDTEATTRRFWKSASVGRREDAYTVFLDHRVLKTPSGNPVLVPLQKPLVAALVAAEWENQETLTKPHALPMVRMSLLTTLNHFLNNFSDVPGFEGN
jgi:ATP synthase F1 complex assembly factor 2